MIMTENETLDMLMRMYALWPSAMPPEDRRKAVGREWHRLLSAKKAVLLNEALDKYAASLASKYMPKPGELLQIYDNLLDERLRKNSLNYADKCPWCLGSGKALIRAQEDKPFYGHYGVLGITCPCRRGEAAALQSGLKITRKIKSGYLDIWLEYDRIWGVLREFGQKEPANNEQHKQQSLKPAFENGYLIDDLPF